jgi:hypothetical protein
MGPHRGIERGHRLQTLDPKPFGAQMTGGWEGAGRGFGEADEFSDEG